MSRYAHGYSCSELGEAAYLAYVRGHKNRDRFPEWDNMSSVQRKGWARAAYTVASLVNPGDDEEDGG